MAMTYPATGYRWGKDVWGHSAVTVADYTGPALYVVGGEAIAAGAVKLGAIELAFSAFAIKSDGTDGVWYVYNRATGKVQAFWGDGAAEGKLLEVDTNTDLSGYTGRMMFMGRG